jgi:DNA-binding response OmpR family regulator
MQDPKINIFYADDDHDDIEFFKDALSAAANEATLESRSDGDGILQLLNNPPPKPSLVFLDWNMPGKNGAYVLKSMMANDKMKDIPVVIISTSDHSINIEQARELGAKMYMTKPTQFKDLVNMIKHCLKIDWSTFRANEENFFYSLS